MPRRSRSSTLPKSCFSGQVDRRTRVIAVTKFGKRR
jgi:hypothetical protein